jgi:hypothetical protein
MEQSHFNNLVLAQKAQLPPPFNKTENALPCSLQPDTDPFSETDESRQPY